MEQKRDRTSGGFAAPLLCQDGRIFLDVDPPLFEKAPFGRGDRDVDGVSHQLILLKDEMVLKRACEPSIGSERTARSLGSLRFYIR